MYSSSSLGGIISILFVADTPLNKKAMDLDTVATVVTAVVKDKVTKITVDNKDMTVAMMLINC